MTDALFGMGSLTACDRAANDVLHLLARSSPRTDAPAALPRIVTNPDPLPREPDHYQDGLMLRRSELRIARRQDTYRDRPLRDYPLRGTGSGFAPLNGPHQARGARNGSARRRQLQIPKMARLTAWARGGWRDVFW